MSVSPTPADFSLGKIEQDEAQAQNFAEGQGGDQISAADYDPSLDRREDEQRRVHAPVVVSDDDEEEYEEEEDIDDMFAVATSERKKVRKVKKVAVSNVQRNVVSGFEPLVRNLPLRLLLPPISIRQQIPRVITR